MPVYDYNCEDCGKDFTVTMRISEHGQKEIRCEYCQSKKVKQKFSPFFVKTSKKS